MLEEWTQRGLRPDLTLLLDLPVEVGLERAGRRSSPDRFEKEELSFFERVRSSYLEIAWNDAGRVKVIDATPPLYEVQQHLTEVVQEFLDAQTDGQ
jgi:dTMP kinase